LGILILRAPRGDGEHGLGVQLRLVGLPSCVLLDLLIVNVLLVVPCLLVGGLDLDSEGPCVDGELGSLHSLGIHVSLLVNLGGLVHDFKLGFFVLRSHLTECITK
jgi:hypothetical protein